MMMMMMTMMSLQTIRYITNFKNGISIRTHYSHIIQQVIYLSFSPILFFFLHCVLCSCVDVSTVQYLYTFIWFKIVETYLFCLFNFRSTSDDSFFLCRLFPIVTRTSLVIRSTCGALLKLANVRPPTRSARDWAARWQRGASKFCRDFRLLWVKNLCFTILTKLNPTDITSS